MGLGTKHVHRGRHYTAIRLHYCNCDSDRCHDQRECA